MGKNTTNRDGFRQMTSFFAGECAWCGKKWPKGKQVWWHPQWKIAVCCPQHGTGLVATRPKTYASARREKMAQSTPMESPGAPTT